MHKSIIMVALSLILFTSIASASISQILVDSISYKDRSNNPIISPSVTGDQIIANVRVIDSTEWNDVKNLIMFWDVLSYLDCTRINDYNKTTEYICTFTVTPFISGSKTIYLRAVGYDNSELDYTLGTWNLSGSIGNLNGTSYPVNPRCTYVPYCIGYQQNCTTSTIMVTTWNNVCTTIPFNKVKTVKQCTWDQSRWRNVCRNVQIVTVDYRLKCVNTRVITPKNVTSCTSTSTCTDWNSIQVCS